MAEHVLRRHQKQAKEHADRLKIALAQRAGGREILSADVTPGGGKTGLFAIVGSELLVAGLIDQILIIVPNVNLGTQVEEGFADPLFNPARLTIRFAKTATAPLLRPPHRGVVATYAAVCRNPDLFRHFVTMGRTAVVLDEVGMLADDEGRAWCAHAQYVAEPARLVVPASGTLFRRDGRRIPFLDYEQGPDGLFYARADVTYSLREAIAQKAVLPIEFKVVDGEVSYFVDGEERSAELAESSPDEEGRKLTTFLSDATVRNRLVDEAIAHWRDWRARKGKRSRVVVVCRRQDQAHDVAEYIRAQHRLNVAEALSDNDDAHDAVNRFRKHGTPDVMVTVAMASIGLDVPDLTHMVFLSDVRSRSWVLQAFARTTRFDRKSTLTYDQQMAFVWVPNDPRMREIVEWMQNEQAVGVRDRLEREATEATERKSNDFVPDGATVTGIRTEAPNVTDVSTDDLAEAERIAQASTITGYSAVELARFLKVSRGSPGPAKATREEGDEAETDGPSTREEAKRRRLQKLCSRLDRVSTSDAGTTNKEIRRRFGERARMTEAQLDAAIAYVAGRLGGDGAVA